MENIWKVIFMIPLLDYLSFKSLKIVILKKKNNEDIFLFYLMWNYSTSLLFEELNYCINMEIMKRGRCFSISIFPKIFFSFGKEN